MIELPPSHAVLVVLVATFAGIGGLAAQDPASFPPGELDALEAEAERAPLFASHEPLSLTLSTRVEYLRDERPDEEEVRGLVTWTREDGSRESVDVEVRTRGNFRRQKKNCSFPPLRLDFPRSRVEGTVFESQDKLKLVVPCRDDSDLYQQYVFQEYLAYRVYNLITPVSHRVRLVEITFMDVDGEYDTRTRMGFLIEAEEQVAHRNRAFVAEFEQWHPAAMDPGQAALMALFQYMIGNTDYSQVFFHNVEMVRSWEEGLYLPIPYDFDTSGVVDARYATPDASLGTGSVRDRVYQGFCYQGVDHDALRLRFQEARDQVWSLYEDFSFLRAGERDDTLEYYDEFYQRLESPFRYTRLLDSCIPLPS